MAIITSVVGGRYGATGRGVLATNLRAGDRAEIFMRGSELVIRLETGIESAAVCSLTWDWGFR